jgi:hypothetical protein
MPPVSKGAPGVRPARLQLLPQDVFDGLSYRFRRAFRNVSIQQYRKAYVAFFIF